MEVVDPVSLVPEFIAITRHESPESRRRTAIRGIVIAAAILIAFIVVGQILLEALGITLPSFSIAGGQVLLAISLQRDLTTEDVHADEEAKRSGEVRDVSVFPLAVEQAQTTQVMLFILALTCALLLSAGTVQRLLGATGADVISRISGLILAALAVETILQGIRASFSLP